MSGRKDFEERKEIKREIYEKRIEKAEQNSKAEYDKHKQISNAIPLGQPILVDHYSAAWHFLMTNYKNYGISNTSTIIKI